MLDVHRHVEIYLNVHGRRGDHRGLVTTRDITQRPAKGFFEGNRNLGTEFISSLQPLAPNLIDAVLNARPSLSPVLLDLALKGLVKKRYTAECYRVLNLGTANLMPAYSMEFGVEVDDEGTHIAAIEEVMRVTSQRRTLGKVYTTSPSRCASSSSHPPSCR